MSKHNIPEEMIACFVLCTAVYVYVAIWLLGWEDNKSLCIHTVVVIICNLH